MKSGAIRFTSFSVASKNNSLAKTRENKVKDMFD